jgi:outer membrane protein assembly factor BamB
LKTRSSWMAVVLLVAASTQRAVAGPLDPPAGRYPCILSQIVATVQIGTPMGTSVQSGPGPFGDLALDGAGGYSLSASPNSRGRYASDTETGALRFTGLLAAFGNTYEVKNGVAHLSFQSKSISFGCSRPSRFRGSFVVSTPAPGSPVVDTPSGPLNGGLKGKIYFTKPDGLFVFDAVKGVETFVRVADGFDVSANGELVWVNRAGELLVGLASGSVQTIPTYGTRAAPKLSRDGRRIAYLGETPPSSVEGAMLSAYATASRQPVVIDRQGNVLAAFGAQYSEPTWTADGRVVMIGAKATGSLAANAQSGIYLSDRSLRSVRRIDPGMELPHSPAVSPSGSQVAFVSAGRIYVMDLDGRNSRVVAAGKSQFVNSLAWSPAGDALIFRDSEQIMVARLDGSVEPLKAPGGLGVYAKSNLAWAP